MRILVSQLRITTKRFLLTPQSVLAHLSLAAQELLNACERLEQFYFLVVDINFVCHFLLNR